MRYFSTGMSFDELPPEVLSLIGEYLSLDKVILSRYSTLTPAFRETVEAITFASIKIDSQELAHYTDLLQAHHPRRAVLRHLEFEVVLPVFTSTAALRFEREPDIRRNNEHASNALSALFTLLAHCDAAVNGRPIELTLGKAYSPMDPRYRTDKDAFYPGTTIRRVEWDGRHRHSFLRHLKVHDLPSIKRVVGFQCGHTCSYDRKYDPATLAFLAAKFPNLMGMHLWINNNELKYPDRRGNMRRDFGDALATIPSTNCQRFNLYFWAEPPVNHHFEPPDVRGNDGPDAFSIGLRNFFQVNNLVNIDLDGPICIAVELFWHKGEALHLPKVRMMKIGLSPCRPQGGYYLIRDPHSDIPDDSDNESEQWAYGSESDSGSNSSSGSESEIEDDEEFFAMEGLMSEEDDMSRTNRAARRAGLRPWRSFRCWPAAELIELYCAVARAAARMHQIQQLDVAIKIQLCPRTANEQQDFGFCYYSRGAECHNDKSTEERERNRLYWDAPNLWEMEGELKNLWKEVMGSDDIVRYTYW